MLSRRDPDAIWTRLDVPELDAEGRLQVARFGDLTIANAYFPNGSGKNRDHSRIPTNFASTRRYSTVLKLSARWESEVLVVGDFNTALTRSTWRGQSPTGRRAASPKLNVTTFRT